MVMSPSHRPIGMDKQVSKHNVRKRECCNKCKRSYSDLKDSSDIEDDSTEILSMDKQVRKHNMRKRECCNKCKRSYSDLEDSSDIEDDSTEILSLDKQAHHNELEKGRRKTLKDAYNELFRALSDFHVGETHKAQGSRLQIIKDAESCIKSMQKKIEAVKKNIDKTKLSNDLLEEKCRNLESKEVLHEPIFQESNEF